MLEKRIEQRQAYHDGKAKELDQITDVQKYTRRLARIMKYHRLISELIATEVKKKLKGDGEMETKEIVRELVTETSHQAFYISADLIKLEVIQGAVGKLMERIDEIIYKKWNEDPVAARISIEEIKDTVRLIDMAFHPLYSTMNEEVKKLEEHSSKLFDIIVQQEKSLDFSGN